MWRKRRVRVRAPSVEAGRDDVALLQQVLHRCQDHILVGIHAQLMGHLRITRDNDPDRAALSLHPIDRPQDHVGQSSDLIRHEVVYSAGRF